jgi:protein CpxP
MNMKSILKPLLVAALLATAGASAFSSDSHGSDGGGMMGQHGMHDGEGRIGITAAQKAAWTTFTTATAPPAGPMAQRPKPEDMAKLTTPERIDKMKAMRMEHHAVMSLEMDKRADATKVFYATLTPEQQKVFDEKAMRRDHGKGGKHGDLNGKGGMMQPKKDAS